MKTSLLKGCFAVLFFGGLIIAGSDGAMFPWLNYTGLLSMAAGAVFGIRYLDGQPI